MFIYYKMSEEINMEETWNEYHENVLRQWGEAYVNGVRRVRVTDICIIALF